MFSNKLSTTLRPESKIYINRKVFLFWIYLATQVKQERNLAHGKLLSSSEFLSGCGVCGGPAPNYKYFRVHRQEHAAIFQRNKLFITKLYIISKETALTTR